MTMYNVISARVEEERERESTVYFSCPSTLTVGYLLHCSFVALFTALLVEWTKSQHVFDIIRNQQAQSCSPAHWNNTPPLILCE